MIALVKITEGSVLALHAVRLLAKEPGNIDMQLAGKLTETKQ